MADSGFLEEEDALEEEEEEIDPEELAPQLFEACRDDDLEKAEELVSLGVPVTFEDEETRWTSLHWAANNGNLRLVQLLLEKGASQAYEDARKKSRFDRNRVMDRLLSNTPLHWASYRGHTHVVWELLTHHYSPDDADDMQNTSLHLSASSGHQKIVEILLKDGANPHVRNKFRNAAIDLCTSTKLRGILLAAMQTPAPTPDEQEKLHKKNIEDYFTAQEAVEKAAALQHADRAEAKEDEKAEGGQDSKALIHQLQSATAVAKEIGVPEKVIDVGRKGENCVVLRARLEEAIQGIHESFPILTQSVYTATVNPLRSILAQLDKEGVFVPQDVKEKATAAIEKGHTEYWLQMALRQVQDVEYATESMVTLLERLRDAVTVAQSSNADPGLLDQGTTRLLVLDGELELSRALLTIPAVKLPILDAPKDYWGEKDKGSFWDDYPEFPLPPPLPEDAEEGTQQEYKWIPSESLQKLRSAVGRLNSALEAVSEANINDNIRSRAEECQRKASGELKQLEMKDEEDRAIAFVAVEKAAKKARKKGKKKGKK